MTHCLLLQPRRRDFSRSSQGLPDLHPALHAPQHCTLQGRRPSALDWQNTLLPRDPTWALPNPHQRPATAATCPPPGYSHKAKDSRQWLDLSHAYQHSPEAAAPSGVYQRDHMYGRHQASTGPTSACRDDRAAALDPDHLCCGGSLPQQQRHQHDVGAQSTAWSPLHAAHSAARSRSITAQHVLGSRGNQAWMMEHPACRLQAEHTAGGLHSQHTAQRIFPQPASERSCVHSGEAVHQHAYSRQEVQSGQRHASGRPACCLPWLASSPFAEQQHGEPASLSHQLAAAELKPTASVAEYAAQRSGLAHLWQRESGHPNLQAADDGNIAAMEKVLAEYKALRLQISEAEAQLSALQRVSPNREDVCWSQPSSCGSHHNSKAGIGHEAWIRSCDQVRNFGDDHTHCREVTSALKALKAAAARQRPAVEAVASQLRSTLSRAHDSSGKEASC